MSNDPNKIRIVSVFGQLKHWTVFHLNLGRSARSCMDRRLSICHHGSGITSCCHSGENKNMFNVFHNSLTVFNVQSTATGQLKSKVY